MRSSTILLLACVTFSAISGRAASARERPNILWITVEDMSATLPAYGDFGAQTPHLDRFAREAVRYTRAFATAPACSPSRATLVTGIYATSLGNPHLRCEMPLPPGVRGYGAYLREAGYFTTNNVKTDYNLEHEAEFVRDTWDVSSSDAHWRLRAKDQPFMAVFNFGETHQSRTSAWSDEEFERAIGSKLAPAERADPSRVPVPPFYPDTMASRRAMARYYDCITAMDKQVGRVLQQLEADGLHEDTIVFFYSDHGMGMPRGKRLLHDSGLHVPLMIRFPARWAHLAPAPAGTAIDRLVSFVDFAPTLLSLAEVPIPAHMQGVAFLGSAAGDPREFVFGARDRVDEAYDTARSVRSGRWLYIRNFRPDLSWAQPEAYSDTSVFRRELLAHAGTGMLGRGPTAWLAPRRNTVELYDTEDDPHQLRNLIDQPAHAATAARLAGVLRAWMLEVRDAALLTEDDVRARAQTRSPYELARMGEAYPLDRILAAAEAVEAGEGSELRQLAFLEDPDPAVRRWGVIGLRIQGKPGTRARAALENALGDSAPSVRIEAAGSLLAAGPHPPALAVLESDLQSSNADVALLAARTLELSGEQSAPLLATIRARYEQALPLQTKSHLERYLVFSLGSLLTRIEPEFRP